MVKVKKKGVLRRDVRNPQKWVFEVWYAERKYPNVISARYPSRKRAREKMHDFMFGSGNLDFYDEVRKPRKKLKKVM